MQLEKRASFRSNSSRFCRRERNHEPRQTGNLSLVSVLLRRRGRNPSLDSVANREGCAVNEALNISEAHGQIVKLHQLYISLTGMVVGLDGWREHVWFDYIKKGFTGDDLRLTVANLNRKRARGEKVRGFKFSNLIGNMDYFEEDLAEARIAARVPKQDCGRAEALRASGRTCPGPAPDTTRNVADIIGSAGFKEFVSLKDTL